MVRRLWSVYLFVFIKTPIAAVGIVAILLIGMNALMDGITLRQFVTVTAGTSVNEKSVTLQVQVDAVKSDVIDGDPIIWYVRQSGERYEGKVLDSHQGPNGITIRIRTEAEDWAKAQAEAEKATGEPTVSVDVPIGEQTVKQRLLLGKEGTK